MTNVQVLGLLHGIGSLCTISFGGILFPLIFFLVKKDEFKKKDLQVFHDIMNFQITYTIFFLVFAVMSFLLIGIPFLIITAILFFINLIIGFINHMGNKRFKFSPSFEFFK